MKTFREHQSVLVAMTLKISLVRVTVIAKMNRSLIYFTYFSESRKSLQDKIMMLPKQIPVHVYPAQRRLSQNFL